MLKDTGTGTDNTGDSDERTRTRTSAEFTKNGASSAPFAAAVRATRMPMGISTPHQNDNLIVFATPCSIS